MSTFTLELSNSEKYDTASWAAVAFIASYSSEATRRTYTTQLRLWMTWCSSHHVDPLADIRRPHIELYARELEARGLAAATIALKLVVLTGFYRYCVEEQLLEHSPSAHVRRPMVSQTSTRLGLDRNELGAFLVQAGLSGGNDHVLACLLGLNALRVSEACGADLDDLAVANGHRTLRIIGKGAQPALIPLAPRTARAIDTAVGERTNGPLLTRSDGRRLDRHAAGRIVRRLAKRAGIANAISPHSLRHAAITAALDAGWEGSPQASRRPSRARHSRLSPMNSIQHAPAKPETPTDLRFPSELSQSVTLGKASRGLRLSGGAPEPPDLRYRLILGLRQPHSRDIPRAVSLVATAMPTPLEAPEREETTTTETDNERDRLWNVVVWNDPVTLMDYVVFVLRKLFGYDKATATRLMMQVHEEGRAVVSSGPREKAEMDVHRLHAHGLQATLTQD